MYFMKYCVLCFIVLECPSLVKGLVKVEQYLNLTRSSEYAFLGKPFTLTCTILKPKNISSYVFFKRNTSDKCVGIGIVNGGCRIDSYNSRYAYNCSSENVTTLTIPGSNMTEYEQNSQWHCESVVNSSFRSSSITLKIAIEVHNISISPKANPLTIREETSMKLSCEVNSNAVPAPTFKWYFGSTIISTAADTHYTTINITGNRKDNKKMLACEATDYNDLSKSANTTLSVEYPPSVKPLPKQYDIKEGSNLSITCSANEGNPSSSRLYWTQVIDTGFKEINNFPLHLPNIQRTSAGTYRCTAENNYINGEKGTGSQFTVVNVLYPPMITNLSSRQDIEEGDDLSASCIFAPGNPNDTNVIWTKVGYSGFRLEEPTLHLPNIQRNSDGIYKCTLENTYPNGGKGTHSQTMVVNVLYPPFVHTLSPKNIIEGGNISITCFADPGNPEPKTFFWTRVNIGSFRQNGTTLNLPNIQRNSSGNYKCTAVNMYNNGKKGSHSQIMVINVLYHPSIEMKPRMIVNERDRVNLTRMIYSNPLSNVTWYSDGDIIKVEHLTSNNMIAFYTIEEAQCSDTKNFTILARNGLEKDATALVELRVNCKPMPASDLITLGVTENTGIQFSTTVVAYPQPTYNLKHMNESTNSQMTDSITMNAVNNFTINFNQTNVDQRDFGVYYLTVSNAYGNATVIVNVLPQRRPDMPRNITAVCEIEGAKLQWTSSFNGGKPQTFIVFAFNDQKESEYSERIPDEGVNVIHTSYITSLRPSELYVFLIYAENGHGNISSKEMTCTTLKKDTVASLSLIVGVAAAGGSVFGIAVIAFFLRRYMNIGKQARKSQRFKNEVAENEEENDDGMKENILYVSAGPKIDEKPEETAVYAAVNKKAPESNNNANVYAEVNKGGHHIAEGALYTDVRPKKGLFKKDVGRKKEGHLKQKKGKQQKSKQNVADVYENAEDIPMSSKSDIVYSNTGQKVQNKEERGYKNKDGLLYVEVQFDAETKKENKIIHGEDEKTDYATVEFPMTASTHDESGSEKL